MCCNCGHFALYLDIHKQHKGHSMTQRTSRMMRIPGALVPAVRALTLAWHLRERELGRGRGPKTDIGQTADDDTDTDKDKERQP